MLDQLVACFIVYFQAVECLDKPTISNGELLDDGTVYSYYDGTMYSYYGDDIEYVCNPGFEFASNETSHLVDGVYTLVCNVSVDEVSPPEGEWQPLQPPECKGKHKH